MNRFSIGQVVSFAIILILQVLLFRNVQVQFLDQYSLSIIVYPIILILLPVTFRRSVVIIMAFFMGIFVDAFYDSPGVHTVALVFTAFIRPYILALLEPRLGYRTNDLIEINHYGVYWFLSFLGLMLFTHIFIYFSVDAFSFVFFFKILINSLSSFGASFLILLLYKLLF